MRSRRPRRPKPLCAFNFPGAKAERGRTRRRLGRARSAARPNRFRAIRRNDDALAGQRRLRPPEQRRLLRAFRRSGKSNPHRGRPAGSRLQSDHRFCGREQLPIFLEFGLPRQNRNRRESGAPGARLGPLRAGGVQGGRADGQRAGTLHPRLRRSGLRQACAHSRGTSSPHASSGRPGNEQLIS